jgi:hypothetical protein
MEYKNWCKEIDERAEYFNKLYGDHDYSKAFNLFQKLENDIKKDEELLERIKEMPERFNSYSERKTNNEIDDLITAFLDGTDDTYEFIHELWLILTDWNEYKHFCKKFEVLQYVDEDNDIYDNIELIQIDSKRFVIDKQEGFKYLKTWDKTIQSYIKKGWFILKDSSELYPERYKAKQEILKEEPTFFDEINNHKFSEEEQQYLRKISFIDNKYTTLYWEVFNSNLDNNKKQIEYKNLLEKLEKATEGFESDCLGSWQLLTNEIDED